MLPYKTCGNNDETQDLGYGDPNGPNGSPRLSLPGFPLVHAILQARTLEWVAFSFSQGSS